MNEGAWTVRVAVAEALRLPEVPVMVRVLDPTGVELLVVSVRFVEPVVGFGFQSAVTPVGKPVTDKVTLPLKPYSGVMAA